MLSNYRLYHCKTSIIKTHNKFIVNLYFNLNGEDIEILDIDMYRIGVSNWANFILHAKYNKFANLDISTTIKHRTLIASNNNTITLLIDQYQHTIPFSCCYKEFIKILLRFREDFIEDKLSKELENLLLI